MNASFIIDGDYGRSKQLAPAFKVSANYKLYMFQSYAGMPVGSLGRWFTKLDKGI